MFRCSTPVRELAHAAGVTAVAVSADGKFIAGAAKDGSVKLWAADGKPIATLNGHPGGATAASFTANGQLLATCGADGTIRFWNPADGKPAGVIGAHGSPVTGVAISPNDNQATRSARTACGKSGSSRYPRRKQFAGPRGRDPRARSLRRRTTACSPAGPTSQ